MFCLSLVFYLLAQPKAIIYIMYRDPYERVVNVGSIGTDCYHDRVIEAQAT